MKKNYFKLSSTLLFAILFLAACKKEMKEINAKTDLKITSALQNRAAENSCRLISTHSEYGDISYTYNERGLLDVWDYPAVGGYFKQEYDEAGRLIKSRFYSGNVLLNTIVFSYENKYVVKETWYAGDTNEKSDELFYTRNQQGLILKAQSFILDYYIINKHTADGSLSEWTFYLGGHPIVTGQYTYLNHYKNPDADIPGLEYGYPAADMGFYQNKWYSTSEDIFLYDENDNPVSYIDQDPYKTIAVAGHQNLVTASDFYDVLNLQWVHFRFTYDNCGPSNDSAPASRSKSFTINTNDLKSNIQKLLMHRSIKSIKEQVIELRKELKNNLIP